MFLYVGLRCKFLLQKSECILEAFESGIILFEAILIFLDSSTIIAYKNADDVNHKKAVDIFQKLNAVEYGIRKILDLTLSMHQILHAWR